MSDPEKGIIEVPVKSDIAKLWDKEPSIVSKMLGNMANGFIRLFKMIQNIFITHRENPPLQKK